MPRTSKKYNERIEIGRGPDGKRIRKWIRANTKPELEALRREAYAKKEQAWNPSAVTVEEYAHRWLATYKPDITMGTRRTYDTVFNHLESINERQISSVTATDLQEIINENKNHATVCVKIRTILKGIFRVAIRDGIYPGVNPAEDLVLPKKKRTETMYIPDEEMDMILACDFDPQERLYIDVIRYSGMRPSEGLALKWEDIDYNGKVIHVSRSIDYGASESKIKGTKTGATRDIPLSSKLATALRFEGKNKGYVFLADGVPPTKSEYNRFSRSIMRKIDAAVGHDGIVIYSFRHTFATKLFYLGVRPGKISTKKAAQIMGHSEKIFIQTYTHIDDTQEQALEIIEEI